MHPEADVTKCQKLIQLFWSIRCDMRATSVSSAKINVLQHNDATCYSSQYNAFKCHWKYFNYKLQAQMNDAIKGVNMKLKVRSLTVVLGASLSKNMNNGSNKTSKLMI